MQTEVLIIGQGICGSLLSWFLEQRGVSYLVADDARPQTASRIATGIINPVSGRMFEKAWMIDEVMPYAHELYTTIGNQLGTSLIAQKDLLDFFPSPQMRLSFTEQADAGRDFLAYPDDEYDFDAFINHSFGYGIIRPCYAVQMGTLVASWRKHLLSNHKLIEKKIEINGKDILASVSEQYDITAKKIIFCDGAEAATGSLFGLLPFAVNKGESLLVRIPGFPENHIFKKTYSLVPLGNELFRWGASYIWKTNDPLPTTAFREQAENQLRHFIKLPFTVEDHQAAFRPATVERRPFAGFHPLVAEAGILNGMGSKGASLAPWFTRQMANMICDGVPVQPEANTERFRKILSR